jgi:hypothetical protein
VLGCPVPVRAVPTLNELPLTAWRSHASGIGRKDLQGDGVAASVDPDRGDARSRPAADQTKSSGKPRRGVPAELSDKLFVRYGLNAYRKHRANSRRRHVRVGARCRRQEVWCRFSTTSAGDSENEGYQSAYYASAHLNDSHTSRAARLVRRGAQPWAPGRRVTSYGAYTEPLAIRGMPSRGSCQKGETIQ